MQGRVIYGALFPVSISWSKFFFWLYLLVLVFAEATLTSPADPDLWHRLALGEVLCRTGQFPPGDHFSYLADYKTIADHEWGSAVVFYKLYQLAGPNVFVVVKLVTLAITLALIVSAGMQGRHPTLFAAAFYALILLALLPSFLSTIRCMTFTHIFFALWLYWYQRERHGHPVSILGYVVTMVLWANLHGGFVMGLAWLCIVGVVQAVNGEAWKPWLLRFGLCLPATLLNPYGMELWQSTARALVVTRRGFGEWEAVSWWPEVMAYPGYKILLLALVAGLAVQFWKRGWKHMDRTVVMILGAFIVLSFSSARHTSLLAAVAGALVPGLFPSEPWIERDAHPLQRLAYMGFGTALVIIPLFTLFVAMPGDGFRLTYPHISAPRGPVEELKLKNIRGNLLVPFNYGSYALWELRGRMRVSMDGRYDLVYKPETYRRVDDFFAARGNWQSLIASPRPDAVIVPREAPVYEKLLSLPGWQEVFQDDTDAVFLPRN